MRKNWQAVFDEAPFSFFLSAKPRERDLLLKAIAKLKNDPGQSPDYFEFDDSGRQVSIKALKAFLLTYWLDHSVKEIRILDVQRITF